MERLETTKDIKIVVNDYLYLHHVRVIEKPSGVSLLFENIGECDLFNLDSLV